MDDVLRRLEGFQTIKTISKELNLTKNSALNLVSKLKKEGFVTTQGGGKQVRLYKVTTKKQLKRKEGMYDIINKYSKNMQLAEPYDHQVHGIYEVEDALIDAIKTESFRTILASLNLFKHITNWPKLYKLAKENDCWQKVGALHDVAKTIFRVRKMPKKYQPEKFTEENSQNLLKNKFPKRVFLIKNYEKKNELFEKIEEKWNVGIPFKKLDIQKVLI